MKNKTLLITGGTGSFGNAVLSEYLKSNEVKQIRIFSRDEKKQEDMRIAFNDKKLKFYIGDVRDYKSVSEAMIGVDYVFHAAELKQVPSCEFYPMQAVHTNIIGAENVLEAAFNNNVKRAVVLSTDKAVYPINAMGISKAMMEKLMVAKSRTSGNTILLGTRYGNVMGSRGSVIPLFHHQIINKMPITITDPKMTRFMMTLEDAVDLVLYAFNYGNSGDILVQKAPSSTIEELADAMKIMYKYSKNNNIIGARHGEKTFETLLTKEELLIAEDLGDFYRVAADNRDLNYNKFFTEGNKTTKNVEDYNSHNTERLKQDELIALIKKIGFSGV